MLHLRRLGLAIAVGGVIASSAVAQPVQRRPDLGDLAEGTYSGDVISDARGTSQSDVHLTVTRVAPSTVEVTSDYERLPTFTVRLTRAMQTIQSAGGREVFLLDLSKSPRRLDVTVDDASWSGDKDPAPPPPYPAQ